MAGFHYLADLNRDEARALAPESALLLPTAAIEQHGPHLPLVTDTTIATEISRLVGMTAGTEVPVCVAPTLSFGSSHHHLVFAALSLRATTFQSAIIDLLETAVSMGFRRIFIVNGHGGNEDAIRTAAREVVMREHVTIAANSYWTVAHRAIKALLPTTPIPGHAGTFETMLMLALAPDKVRMNLAPSDSNHPKAIGSQGLFDGTVLRHGDWERIGGFSDSSVSATGEQGKLVLKAIVDSVSAAVIRMHREA